VGEVAARSTRILEGNSSFAWPVRPGSSLAPAAVMDSRADGFSLVEVMVATCVLAVGLVALVQL